MANAMNESILQLDLPGINKLRSGKVRELFDLDDRLLLTRHREFTLLGGDFPCLTKNGVSPRLQEIPWMFRGLN